jgi:hypothetical protein
LRPVNEKRLSVEQEYRKHAVRRGLFWWARWENLSWMEPVLGSLLKLCGLYARGYQNVLNVGFSQQKMTFSRLPDAFDGFRILWISDLHLDRLDGLLEKVLTLTAQAEFDIAILGGDFCFDHFITDLAAARARQVAQALLKKAPVYAVFGNHDFSPLAEVLRGCGVTLLLNENTTIDRRGQTIRLVGVDDCHYFKADDLDLALEGADAGEFKILLSHSPELYAAAARKGFDLCLSGHTHGGQICLPGGTAVVYSAAAPRKCIRGLWNHDGMVGYTSGGAGASGVPVRYNCPGEINLFTLRKPEHRDLQV